MTYDSRPETYKHIQTVQGFLNKVIANLLKRSQEHDQSKLVSPEVEIFDEYTPRLKDSTYGSDEYKELLKGMGKGLEHHYCVNRHHPEYFCFQENTYFPEDLADGTAIKGMTLLDIMEMVCDWAAACQRHNDGNILDSIEINQKRFGYSDELKAIIKNTVKNLKLDEKPGA